MCPDDVEFVKQHLSEDPSEEILELVANAVVDEMEDAFPELALKSEPISEALSSFREDKLDDVDTEEHYETKLNYMETYFKSEVVAETTDELTSEDVEDFKSWRKVDSLDREEPLSNNTLQDDMYLFREFIESLVEHRMVPARFEKVIEIPDVDYEAGEGIDEKKLDPELAKAALEHLRKYHYADVEHVVLELCCNLGPRKSGLRGRDKGDFDDSGEDAVLYFQDREEQGLKNDRKSNRGATLYGRVPTIVRDYLDDKRPAVTDENGREPLLTKGDGRISKSTIQKIAYKWTRPCQVGLICPHDKDPDECEAAQKNNSAYKCPSSRAPQHIRKGFITDSRNRGVSPEAIDWRCDVSPRVQSIHYDLPDIDEERSRYEDEFRNANCNPDSGYST